MNISKRVVVVTINYNKLESMVSNMDLWMCYLQVSQLGVFIEDSWQ